MLVSLCPPLDKVLIESELNLTFFLQIDVVVTVALKESVKSFRAKFSRLLFCVLVQSFKHGCVI